MLKSDRELLEAIKKSDLREVKLLLQNGASPNGVPDRSPVAFSVRSKDLRILSKLLEAGGNPKRKLRNRACTVHRSVQWSY